jgi:hypothetical protein
MVGVFSASSSPQGRASGFALGRWLRARRLASFSRRALFSPGVKPRQATRAMSTPTMTPRKMAAAGQRDLKWCRRNGPRPVVIGFRFARALALGIDVRRRSGELRAEEEVDDRGPAEGRPGSTGWTERGRSSGSGRFRVSGGSDRSSWSTADSPMKRWISFSRSSLNRGCSAIAGDLWESSRLRWGLPTRL